MVTEPHVFELGQRNFSDPAAVSDDTPEPPYLGVLGLTAPPTESEE